MRYESTNVVRNCRTECTFMPVLHLSTLLRVSIWDNNTFVKFVTGCLYSGLREYLTLVAVDLFGVYV